MANRFFSQEKKQARPFISPQPICSVEVNDSFCVLKQVLGMKNGHFDFS